MNRIIMLLVVAASLTTQIFAEDVTLKSASYSGPVTIHKPFVIDSTNVKGQTYSDKSLLQQTAVDWTKGTPSDLSVSADGQFVFAAQSAPAIHAIRFFADCNRFVKGTLTVASDQDVELYMDGKKQTLAKGAVELSLDPKRYEFIVKCMTQDQAAKVKVSFTTKAEDAIAFTNDPTRVYTLHDVIEGRRIRNASISPDGKSLIISYSYTYPGGKSENYTEVSDMATKEVLYRSDDRLEWLSKSNRVAFTRDGKSGKDLIFMDPATRRQEVVATNIPGDRFMIGPNDDKVIFYVREEGPKERADLQQILTPEDRQPGWRDRSVLYLMDLKSGVTQQLTYGYRQTFMSDWSKDGRQILIAYSTDRYTKRPFNLMTFCRMNLETMEVQTIYDNSEYINQILFSPDGKQLLVMGAPEAFGGIGLNIDPGQKSNMSDAQLFMTDADGKNVKPLTKEFDPAVNEAAWNAQDNRIYILATDRDRISLFRMDPSTGKISNMKAAEEVVASFECAKTAPVMTYWGESVSNTQRLYALDMKKNQTQVVVDLNPEVLKDVKLGEVKDWSYVTTLGDTIIGRFYLPPTFDANKKYPLIVNYYGGTSPTERVFESRYPEHTYSGQGYIYLVLQPSGTVGFGQKFSARHVDAWGKFTGEDIIQGTKQFLTEHPYADAKKIGCIGASYGGFMTQYLMTKTDIFAAAISHAGISDVTSYWGEGYWGYSYNQIAAADSYPWTDRDLYTKDSPLFNADKVHTPLLFLHGTADTNVPIGESIQMFTALKLLGRTAEFVQVEGQNHHIMQYDKRLRWNDTIYAWFAKWLKDEPEWWDSLYPPKKL